MKSIRLKYIATPGALPSNSVAIISYFVMAFLLPLSLIPDSGISFHALYVLPIIAIALHCQRTGQVVAAVCLSIVFQAITSFSSSFSLISASTELLIAIVVSISVAYVARIARHNYLETKHLASVDALTGLHTRRTLESILEMEVARQKRYGGAFSLAFFDIDNFKIFNNARGRNVGDEALKLFAQILRDHTRESDYIARVGGDTFAMLLPRTLSGECVSLCQKISEKTAHRMADASFELTISIGCSTFEQAPQSALEALLQTDKAMHVAKQNGKGRTVSL